MHHGSLIVAIHVHPCSRRAAVGGRHGEALVVRVAARAVDGAANEEVLAALADAFAVRRRDVNFVRVTRSREKIVTLHGDKDVLNARLAALRDGDVVADT